MSEEIFGMTRRMIAEIAEIDEEMISGDSDFRNDLGIDSMMALEIMADVEKAFGVVIDESELQNFRNLNEVLKVIKAAMGSRVAL